MKFKTVCVGIAATMTVATGMIFVPQDYAVAQSNQAKQTNSRESGSLQIRWVLGIFPWFAWSKGSNSPVSQSTSNTTFANTNIGRANTSKSINTQQGYNHKEAPLPVLIPGLAALGVGLIRKRRQEQEQIEIE